MTANLLSIDPYPSWPSRPTAVPTPSELLAPVFLDLQRGLVADWLLWFDDQVAKNLRAPATATKYRQVIRYWLTFLETQERSDAPTPGSLDRYQMQLAARLRPSSTNLYLEAVRSLYAWAERKDRYPNIARSLEVIRVRRDGPLPAFTEGEVQDMVRACAAAGDNTRDLRNRILLALLFGTAIRGSSLLECNVGDYDPTHRILRFRTKGGREASSSRQVPERIAQRLEEYLQARAQAEADGGPLPEDAPLFTADNRAARGHRLTTAFLRQVVAKATTDAGLTTAARGVHALRRAALVAVADDLGIEAAQEAAGHASVTTTRAAYAGVKKATVHAAVAQRLNIDC